MKFAIAGKVYDAADLQEVTLKDILLFEQQTRDFGRELHWSQVNEWADAIGALKTNRERLAHPGMIWLTAASIWAARRLSGEDVTFDQAVDFPMSQLSYLPEPRDRKKPANPTKAAPRRTGSGRAAAHRPRAAAAAPAGAKTSGTASAAG